MIIKIQDTYSLTAILALFSLYIGWLLAGSFAYTLVHVALISTVFILLGLGIVKQWQKVYSFLSKILLLASAVVLIQEVIDIFSGQASEYLLLYIVIVTIAVCLNHFAHQRTLAPWMLLMTSIKVQVILLYSITQNSSQFAPGEVLFYLLAALPIFLLAGVLLVLFKKRLLYKLLVFILTLFSLSVLVYLYVSTNTLDVLTIESVLLLLALVWPLFAIRLVGKRFILEYIIAKQ